MATLKLTGKFSPILIGLLLLLTPAFSWASEPSASLYLSPSSTNVVSGGTLGISLKEDSGSEPINTVATKIYYPSDKLAFINHDPTGNFSGVALDSSIAGILNISAYKFGDPRLSGAQQVTAINFKAITSSGTAGINLEANFDESVVEHYSSVTSSNSNKNILKKVSAGAYTITQQPSGSTSTAPSSQVIAPSQLSQNPVKSSPLASGSDKNKQATVGADTNAFTTKNAKIVAPNTAASNTELSAKSSSLKDKIIMLLSLPTLVVGALAVRTANRKYKDKKAKKKVYEHHGASKKETVAEIAARIKRKNRSEETVAELAARIRRKKHR